MMAQVWFCETEDSARLGKDEIVNCGGGGGGLVGETKVAAAWLAKRKYGAI
jgi:hypothetical protein